MRYRRLVSFFAVLGCAAFLINLYSRKNLAGAYVFRLGYDQLYTNDSSFFIKNIFTKEKDHAIEIEIGGTDYFLKNIEVTDSTGVNFPSLNNIYSFKVVDGITKCMVRYKVTHKPVTSFYLNFASSALYSGYGREAPPDYEILNCEIPYLKDPIISFNKWVKDFDKKTGSDIDLTGFFADSLKIVKEDSTLEKIKKIGAYFLPYLEHNNGAPADSVLDLNPYDFLQAVKNGKTKVWCGNYSLIMQWFCYQAGIKVRIVSISAPADISFGEHVVCEIFVPELRQWILCDPTNRLLFIRNGNYYLNTADLYRLLKMRSSDPGIVAGFYHDGKVTDSALFTISNRYEIFYNRNSEIRYYYSAYLKNKDNPTLKQRLFNMISVKPNYASYSDSASGSFYEFYLRMVSGYILISCFVAILLLLFSGMFFRRQP